MSKATYAIIPLRLEYWTKGEPLSADCLNDLHSSNNAIAEVFGEPSFRAYDDNRFRFKTTDNLQYQLPAERKPEYSCRILLDVLYFSQNGFESTSGLDFVEITNVTARKLMQLAEAIHQQVS